MTLLHGRLELHGVDVEKLAAKAVDAWLRNHRSHLQESDRDDLLAFVVSELWRTSLTWTPEHPVGFATFAYRIVGARVVDWFRLKLGRSKWTFGDGTVYERERPVPLSLDAPTASGSPLGATLTGGAGDGEADRGAFIAGLEDSGDGSRDRDHALLRAAAARGSRGGAA